MKLSITHTTEYHYTEAKRYAVQTLWLTPQTGPSQTVLDWRVQVPGVPYAQRDGFGNGITTYTFLGSTQESLIRARGQVQTHAVHELADDARAPHPLVYLRDTALAEAHPRLREFGLGIVPGLAAANASVQPLLALAQAVCHKVAYRKNSTHVQTTALEAFDWEAGVCQDQAHVMIAVCRSLGIPARYVSGYFYVADEPDLASHAWVDVCVDVAAHCWVSIDVTHACVTDERHARLAVGTDYAACPPIKGIRYGGGEESMTVSVQIERLS
jgi:transglutaminase-like putative cysteine protease